MFVLPKTRRLGVNTISHQPLVGEQRPMSHGRTQLCPQNGQCQRLVRGPDHGSYPTPAPWGLRPQDLGAAGPPHGPTTRPALAVPWDAHLGQGTGLLLCGTFLLSLGNAALVFWFTLQLHGILGHLLAPIWKMVAADGMGDQALWRKGLEGIFPVCCIWSEI